MTDFEYKSMIVEEFEKGKFKRFIGTKKISELPENNVLIKVLWSALNYKDALSARGHKGISRYYPHTPGIDAAGIVEASESSKFTSGQKVLVTGYDLGMNTSGGFGQYIRVPADWIVPLPDGLGLRESMIYGTAGFTAATCIHELIRHNITTDKGKILVTGATGGVGSLAVGMLSKIGYEVTATTGKPEKSEMLKEIGAAEILGRESVYDTSGRPLLSGRWAGAIDTVGGNTLSTVVRSLEQHGCVCCLGNVESDKLETSVYPFLLRGVTITGIDSASRPMDLRLKLWNNIAGDWKIDNFEKYVKEVTLDNLSEEIDIILRGGQAGKVIVNNFPE